jgi:hypothetical protein
MERAIFFLTTTDLDTGKKWLSFNLATACIFQGLRLILESKIYNKIFDFCGLLGNAAQY